jgi:hypothetical protein
MQQIQLQRLVAARYKNAVSFGCAPDRFQACLYHCRAADAKGMNSARLR